MSWLASIFFKNPYYLLFAIIPMLYGAWYVWKHRITFTSFQSSGAKAIDSLPTSSLAKLRHLPTILHVLGLLALIVALARPQTRDDWKDSKIRGIDIMLAMDVSTSMTATDFRPNRLAVAKKMASQFVEKRVNDRLGFVQFAGESFTQCPLTIDHRVVQNLLLDTKPGILKDGTAMGMGISTAVYRLKESDAKSKVIVMLTDGVNNQGNVSPQTAAEIASSFGIKVYTIGIGSNEAFSNTPYGRMKNEIDEEVLKEIALETGGKYFRAKTAKQLSAIYDEIDQLETTEISVTEYSNYKEEFYVPALIGFILLLAGVLLKNTVLKTLP